MCRPGIFQANHFSIVNRGLMTVMKKRLRLSDENDFKG